jgi:septum site-determining protein MinD
MATETLALVGAAGGVGTTRLTVECGATLARTGRSVALFDAAFTTQGLGSYLDGPIERDATALATGDAALEETLYDHPADLSGDFALCPARAPFERLAQAKTAGAAERFERQIAAASLSYDVVLVDTPPVGANQALAAVNAADSVAVVTENTERGADALTRTQDRLADVGAPLDAVIANHSDSDGPLAPDAHVPESDVTAPQNCPVCATPDGSFAPAVAAAVEMLFDRSLDVESSSEGRFGGFVGSS